ncbi:MAG TPA: MarR family transcriptional regulator [Arachidicoccus soli]|nr:MarR family transcriptional regulator [Arachidicoccus soli]
MNHDNEYLPKVYRSVYHRARLNVLFSASWMGEFIRRFMEKYDITGQQYNILRIIHRNQGNHLSVLQLREQMFEKMSDTSRLVDRLIAKGLVGKRKSTVDRRLVEIYLTTQGEDLLTKILAGIEVLDLPLKGLTEEEAEILSNLLVKMRRHESNK